MKRILISLAIAASVIGCSRQTSAEAASVPVRRAQTPESDAVPIRSSIDIVFLGDSLARGTGDESGEGLSGIVERELRQRGVAVGQSNTHAVEGARTGGLLTRMANPNMQQDIRESDVIVLSIGANDLFVDSRYRPNVSPESLSNDVLQRLDIIIARVHELNPEARIFLIGLYNPFFDKEFSPVAERFVQRWNDALVSRYDHQGVTIVETFDLLDNAEMLGLDRFHPSAAGYRAVARRIAAEM